MAEIAYDITTTDGGDALVIWSGVTEADTFERYDLDKVVSEVSVHVTGTFGGATVTIGGGNVTSEMLALMKMDGTNATATSADIFSLLDRPLYITPSASGGSSQSVTIYMLVRK